MTIKFSKDYYWTKMTYESDKNILIDMGDGLTLLSDYSGTWEVADVTLEQLQEYVNKGYAIKINC